MSGLAWSIVAGGVALLAGGSMLLARALVKGKARKAVEEARQRMDAVGDNKPAHHTAERLRRDHF